MNIPEQITSRFSNPEAAAQAGYIAQGDSPRIIDGMFDCQPVHAPQKIEDEGTKEWREHIGHHVEMMGGTITQDEKDALAAIVQHEECKWGYHPDLGYVIVP